MAISRRTKGLTLPSVAEALPARTKECLPVRREASCNRHARRVPAAAFSRACTVVNVILGEADTTSRLLERTRPIDTRAMNGCARRIERQPRWAERQVRGGVDNVVGIRTRGHQQRAERLGAEVVRKECTPSL